MFNRLKTVFLLGLMTSLLMGLGSLVGGYHGVQIALIIAIVMNGMMYFYSDKIVLNMYKAQPLDRSKYGKIYTMVEHLAATMHIPLPKLWLVDTPMANAFATGRNPAHASVALTTGIIALLDEHELRGVIAHELSHVKNRDILVSTIAATMASAIGYIANMLRYTAFWGQHDRRSSSKSNPLFLLLIGILMPIGATLIRLAISRSREYLADESGSQASHDPLALADALKKLHTNIASQHLDPNDMRHTSTASLFIIHPFIGTGFANLFATHPPMEERIKRLEQLSKQRR